MTRLLVVCLLLTVLGSSFARGQDLDPAKFLGPAPKFGPLPAWPSATDVRQKLGEAARGQERAIMLIGKHDFGSGTAWVVSKKHRLLITNAHMADAFYKAKGEFFAIPSGTSQAYKVEKCWYHPGVRRWLKDSGRSVRSIRPEEGDIDTSSPDLAVMQLSAEGPELEAELKMATPEEVKTLFAQSVAIIGFPGTDTKEFPTPGHRVACTFNDGVISRVTDFSLDPAADERDGLFVQYTMSTWNGFSGSPVILPNGHVAVVHNMSRTEKRGEDLTEVRSIAHGIRIDAVWEMLVHYSLADKVALPIDAKLVSADRWLRPDARSAQARFDLEKAVALANEADRLIFTVEDYKAGIAKCEEALRLAPNYARVFWLRGRAFNNYWFDNQNEMSEESQEQTLLRALQDTQIAVRLNPTNTWYAISACSGIGNLARVTGNKRENKKAIAILTEILANKDLPADARAEALKIRGANYKTLGDVTQAQRDYNEAVKLDPNSPAILETRARFLRSIGREYQARADEQKAKELRAKQK